MKILVIRYTSMGDVVLATSVFEYLKQRSPSSHITFLTDEQYAELFKDDPRLFQVIGSGKKSAHKDAVQLFDDKWDGVIDLQNNKRSMGIKKRAAPSASTGLFKKNYGKRMLLLLTRLNFYGPDDHVVKRYIKAAGGQTEQSFLVPSPKVYCNDRVCASLHDSLFNGNIIRPLITLFPFSAWKNKEWERRNYCTVGQYFLSKGWNVVILGGPEESRVALDMQKEIGPRSMALAGKLSLYECACLLHKTSLALGNDTGLSHLARACGVRTGVIFGATTSHFGFFPFGDPPFKVFQADFMCRPCHPHGGNICIFKNRPCLSRITPETVIAGLEELHRTAG